MSDGSVLRMLVPREGLPHAWPRPVDPQPSLPVSSVQMAEASVEAPIWAGEPRKGSPRRYGQGTYLASNMSFRSSWSHEQSLRSLAEAFERGRRT